MTTGELANHGHDVFISTTSLVGEIYQSKGAEITSASGIVSVRTSPNTSGGHNNAHEDLQPTYTIDASHTHTVSVNGAGNNKLHNNVQPYTVIHRWRRVS